MDHQHPHKKSGVAAICTRNSCAEMGTGSPRLTGQSVSSTSELQVHWKTLSLKIRSRHDWGCGNSCSQYIEQPSPRCKRISVSLFLPWGSHHTISNFPGSLLPAPLFPLSIQQLSQTPRRDALLLDTVPAWCLPPSLHEDWGPSFWFSFIFSSLSCLRGATCLCLPHRSCLVTLSKINEWALDYYC